ncbi:MAG: SsrA-binding protein [Candidatus Peregrinibacteria bacterium Greene0416_19]|nr:MAG: SsrA-binding protein [Candidatus Peregrinibacteria bacterium Greene0416_19]
MTNPGCGPIHSSMKVVAHNRRARFDYEILDTVEAGIVLIGGEVKSCRGGQVNLSGAYVSFLGGKPFLKKAKISAYKFAALQPGARAPGYEPERDRELLMKKSEAERLRARAEEKGMTIVPLEVRAGKYIKVLLGVGRGRKTLDKRQRIKERETSRRLREGRDL